MFELLIDCNVIAMVTGKGEAVYVYRGTLVEENEKTIILKNCRIEMSMTASQRNMNFLGSDAFVFQDNVESVIINKEYIMSCNKI